MQGGNQALYEHCRGLQKGPYRCAYKFGSMDDSGSKWISAIRELEFHSEQLYMSDEIVELMYLKGRKAPLKPIWAAYNRLTGYLNSTGFQNERYTLTEFINILHCPPEDRPLNYIFGHASTDPTIVEFIQNIPLKPPSYKLCDIKKRLANNTQNVIMALQKGAPYNLMAEMLSKECNSWIFSLCPSIFEDEKVGRLFIELSHRHYGPIPPDVLPSLTAIKHFLVRLPSLSDKKIAMEKLLLMICFPKKAQLIHNSSYPIIAFGAILMEELSEWRRDVAEEIDWEGEEARGIFLVNRHLRYIEGHYKGHKENLIFDDFILAMLQSSVDSWRMKRMFIREVPEKFLPYYKKKMIEQEFQGTVYSIIKDRYKLEWGPINPLSEEINPEFEKECVNILEELSQKSTLTRPWFISQYVNAISRTSIPISRLIFYPEYSIDSLVIDYCQTSQEASVRAMRKVYKSLTHYCQPEGGYRIVWDRYAKGCSLDRSFNEIWTRSIKNCNVTEGLGKILKSLEDDHINPLTKTLLLQLFEDIVKRRLHKEAAKMEFTTWLGTMSERSSMIFNELYSLAVAKIMGTSK